MGLLLVRVLEELVRDGAGMNPLGHEVVQFVTKHAHDLRGQRIVQNLDHGLGVAAIGGGDGTLFDVLARAGTQCLDVGEKRFAGHWGLLVAGFYGWAADALRPGSEASRSEEWSCRGGIV